MTLTLELSPVEVEVMQLAQSLGGFRTLEDLARVSLWMEAEHLGVDVPQEAFALPFTPELSRLLAIERQRRDAVDGDPAAGEQMNLLDWAAEA